ncbi:MAG: 8-amino-7-oxononanoate synthase [Thermodesulfovibrionia bacterium]
MKEKGYEEEVKRLKRNGLLRSLITIQPLHGSRITINGKTYINFSSNDYLGLSRHPEVIGAAIKALRRYGIGSGASRLLSGTYPPHTRLEEVISRFKKTESAILFNSGYSANTGIIPAISGPDTVIFSDELNHASIIDGIRLSRAEVHVYRHRDVAHLESLIKRSNKKRLIITDAVFSMDGDIAPLREMLDIAKRHDCSLMVDDAHGTGVLGEKGRGAVEHLGIKDKDVIQMGTLSKAVGCFGGFVAGTSGLVEFLINKARSFIYSTSIPPSVIEACIKAIEIIADDSEGLRERLWRNRKRLYEGLKDLGYDTMDSETQIIPILTGGVDETMRLSKHLYRDGIFAPAIRPPTVPEGKCRIRFSVTSMHTDEDIDRVLESLRKWRGYSNNGLSCYRFIQGTRKGYSPRLCRKGA